MQYALAFAGFVALASANPILVERQAVTAKISPTAPAPPGCSPAFATNFGIGIQNVSTSAAPAKRQVTQMSDGQPFVTMGPVSMIKDGQIQGGMHTMVMMPVANQIKDGQIQIQTTLAPVTEFSDGQPVAPTVVPSSQVGQQSDAQPTVAATSAPAASPAPAPATSAAAPASSAAAPASSAASSAAASSAPKTGGTGNGYTMTECKAALSITLAGGVLTDQDGQTGYIASNYQFQFNKPPQAGAIYTAGFSDCANGTLAIGGSAIFYQCLSGKFYNVYDRSWAAQCSPVYINVLEQVAC